MKYVTSLLIGFLSLFSAHHPAPVVIQPSVPIPVATTTPPVPVTTVHKSKPVVSSVSVPVVPPPAVVVVPTIPTPKITCPSGQIVVSGTCQWTASSTSAIAQATIQLSQKKQDVALAQQQAIEKQIEALQDSYASDLADEQSFLNETCLTPNYDRVSMASLSSFGSIESVSEGIKQNQLFAALEKDEENCGQAYSEQTARINEDEASEAYILNQIQEIRNRPQD